MAGGPHPARLNNWSGQPNDPNNLFKRAYFFKIAFPIELGNVPQCLSPSSLQYASVRDRELSIVISNYVRGKE